MCVRLTDRALRLTECASSGAVRLKQCAPGSAHYCASGRSSLQVAIAIGEQATDFVIEAAAFGRWHEKAERLHHAPDLVRQFRSDSDQPGA